MPPEYTVISGINANWRRVQAIRTFEGQVLWWQPLIQNRANIARNKSTDAGRRLQTDSETPLHQHKPGVLTNSDQCWHRLQRCGVHFICRESSIGHVPPGSAVAFSIGCFGGLKVDELSQIPRGQIRESLTFPHILKIKPSKYGYGHVLLDLEQKWTYDCTMPITTTFGKSEHRVTAKVRWVILWENNPSTHRSCQLVPKMTVRHLEENIATAHCN